MMDIIALICAIGISHSDCVPQTARVVEKIGEARLPIECLRSGALNSQIVRPQPDEYLKLMCVRR